MFPKWGDKKWVTNLYFTEQNFFGQTVDEIGGFDGD